MRGYIRARARARLRATRPTGAVDLLRPRPMNLPRPLDIMKNNRTRERRVFLGASSRQTRWNTIPYTVQETDLLADDWTKVGQL